MAVEFSDEIEEFVSETALQEWWNRGIAEQCLRTYCWLSQNCIAKRFRMLKATKWRLAINGMLSLIPSIDIYIGIEPNRIKNEKFNEHLESINTKLIVFEKLRDIATLLELALMVHRLNACGSAIIIPNVLSFLMVDRWPDSEVTVKC